MNVLLVGCGGFLGAVLRYLISCGIGKLFSGRFPLATLLINIAGCFLIGFVTAVFINNKRAALFFATGILGGFTTFSTFSLETLQLWQNGDTLLAALNIFLSMIFGLLGVVAGKKLAALLLVQS